MSRRDNPKINSLFRKSEDYHTTYQDAFEQMQKAVGDIEAQGKVPMIKEPIYDIADPSVVAANLDIPGRIVGHIPKCVESKKNDFVSKALHPNPTVLPDYFMHTVYPVILIRHPALMIPSYYRISKEAHGATVDDEDFPINVTFRWSRLIFDYYRTINGADKPGIQATVLDSSRMLGNPEEVMTKVCEAAGLDAGQLQFQWTQVLEEQKGKVSEGTMAFRRDFLLSTGVERKEGVEKEVSLEREVEKWEEEFGWEVAGVLRGFVEGTMEDYLYLRQFAL